LNDGDNRIQNANRRAGDVAAMIIRISAPSKTIEIDDARNFKAFSVRIEGSFDDPAVEAELLGRVASSSDREHAWISEKVLREWPQLSALSGWALPSWRNSLFRLPAFPHI
jgi:hypothetical protein